jgi:hypothetical protein
MGHDEAGIGEGAEEGVDPQHVGRRLEAPGLRRLPPLQELQHPALVEVGGGEVGLGHPCRVGRYAGECVVHLRLEIQRHEVQALHGPIDIEGYVLLRADVLAVARRVRDARVRPLDGRGGGTGLGRLPPAEIADLRVPGQQERQDRRARARQAEADQWRHDGDVLGVGMPPVPVLDLKPIDEMFDESGVDDRLPGGVQARLLV